MSEFIAFLPPPGNAISKYDRNASYLSQQDSIPGTFREAMSIRETVFVHEQHVPLESELDSDDARSWHWVTYASVGHSAASPPANRSDPFAKRGSTASRLAVGTVRLVPPPHPPHPTPGSTHQIDNSENVERVSMRKSSVTSGSHETHLEPYIKLGRLATLHDFRRLGLAKLLVDTALDWASTHAEEILPPPSATSREQARVDGLENEIEERWNGLVLVHAQKKIAKVWAKWGFKRDDSMGEWDEEGIAHVGMWRRIHLKGQ